MQCGTKTYPCGPTHGLRHLLIAPKCLYAQSNGLQLRPHLVELLNVSSGANEILCHNFASVLDTNALLITIPP